MIGLGRSAAVLSAVLIALTSTSTTAGEGQAGVLAQPSAEGAFATGEYRNLFAEWDPRIGEAEVDARLRAYWDSLFGTDPEATVYYPDAPNENGPTAYIFDVFNDDVRSEGLSYGMMIAVQMDRKAAFDALWNWAYSHMRYDSGPREGYFRWQCAPGGCPRDTVPASDGEEYFAMALFFAARKWGNGEGMYDYERQANTILDVMLHKEAMNGGVVEGVRNMFDREERQVVFVPIGEFADFTDPSYHLPAFYELWGRWAAGWNGRTEEDRRFWLEAAERSRRLFAQAAHPVTGLVPDYSTFDGEPVHVRGHGDFRYDAFRTAVNWAVDHAWWAADPEAVARTDRLQAFFESHGMETYPSLYAIDGTPLTDDRSDGLIASNGAASLAASHPRGAAFVAALWDLEPPRGRDRYYGGLLQFMAVMHAGGRFRIP